jgi:ABC-type sugar transport system ATPase subunit
VISVNGLSLRQGTFTLNNVSLTVPTGRYGVLMGKTGCGKTTILEAIAGLRPIRSGSITLDGREVTSLAPGARGVGYVPQDGALFPTMTVRQHLAFALMLRRWSERDMENRVEELADWLGVTPLLDRYPRGLSGGEAQRVALGRALSFRPKVLLLDEPLSSLDEETGDHLMPLLKSVGEDSPVTVLHITHSRREADLLGEVRLRWEAGQIIPQTETAT